MSSSQQDATAPEVPPAESAASDSGLLAAWFDDIPAALWMVEGPEHHVVWMNRAARASTADRSMIVGRPARDVTSDFLDHATLVRMDAVFASGTPLSERDRSVTDRDRHGNPVELLVNVSIVPTRGSDGRVRGLVVQRLDVSQAALHRRQAAQDITELGARLNTSEAVVSTMQKVLLPGLLPLLPGLRLSARYLFGRGDVTGGDWFDAVPLTHDRVALVVGDVVGHGAGASAVMGQLRAVLMSYLLEDMSAGDAIARLDRFADRLPGARGTTVAVGVLDRSSGQLGYTSCAHPPPIVISSDGRSRVLPIRQGPSLGSGGAERPVVDSVTLWPEDTLVIYSDGLIESPGSPLSAGIARLSRALSGAGLEAARRRTVPTPHQLCQTAVELIGTDPNDDFTVLAAQFTGTAPPTSFEVTIPAEAAGLPRIRARLRKWLRLLDAADDDQTAIVLATTEAITNAIEHAYLDRAPATVRVEALLDAAGRVCVTVSDHGRWRDAPIDPGYRGRGLTIMRAVMDSVEIDHDTGGTAVMMERQLGHPVIIDQQPVRPPEITSGADDLTVEISRGERPVLTARGPIDITTAETFNRALADASRGGTLAVTVDLSAVTVLSSVGVQALAQLIDDNPLGVVPSLIAPLGTLAREVLALSGLDRRAAVAGHPPPARHRHDDTDQPPR